MKKIVTTIAITLATLMMSACSSDNGGDDTPIDIQEPIETKEYCVARDINGEGANSGLMVYEDKSGYEHSFEWMCLESVRVDEPCFGITEEANEFITDEYCKNIGLSMMNTSSAYVAGASGEGIVVAVLDSMVDGTHKELKSNLSSASRAFASSNSAHGTEVAGVIASAKNDDLNIEYDGEGMQGVAYNSEILSLGTFGSVGNASADVISAINYAVNYGVSVVNMSMGGLGERYINRSSEYKLSILNALSSDVTFVVGSGNNSQNCNTLNTCAYPATLPFVSGNGDLLNGEGGWIVVGAVNLDGKIAGLSNRAGITKNNYVVALGQGAYTTHPTYGYVIVDGTSFSTPHVSGVVALLKEAFPYLSGKEIANVIFETCTDLGEKGVDDVYGHGLVNVKKAFELAETL